MAAFCFQDLEEELELDRKRVLEAEGGAKRAEEELAVAKERLLLQEDELQSRAGRGSVCSHQSPRWRHSHFSEVAHSTLGGHWGKASCHYIASLLSFYNRLTTNQGSSKYCTKISA